MSFRCFKSGFDKELNIVGQISCYNIVTREDLCLTHICCRRRHFLDSPVHVIHWLPGSCEPAGAAVLLQVTGAETRSTAEPEGKGHQRWQVVVERVQPGEAQAKTTCSHKATTQAGSARLSSAWAAIPSKRAARNKGDLCWLESTQPHPEVGWLFLPQTCLLALG